jgi:chromosome segregation ATPase
MKIVQTEKPAVELAMEGIEKELEIMRVQMTQSHTKLKEARQQQETMESVKGGTAQMSEVSQRKLQERYNRVHVELLSLLGQSVSRIKELSAKHKTLKDQILDAHHSHNQAVSDLQEARAMLAAASQRIDENARELNFKQKERAELEAELEAFHNKTRSMEKKIRELKEKLADDKTFEGQCRLQLTHIAELNGLIEHVRVSLTWSCHGLAVCLAVCPTRRPFAARNPTLRDRIRSRLNSMQESMHPLFNDLKMRSLMLSWLGSKSMATSRSLHA